MPLGIRVRLSGRLLAPDKRNLSVSLTKQCTTFSFVVVNAVHDDLVPFDHTPFMVTTSDSNAGGMEVLDVESAEELLPANDEQSGSTIDGVDGTGTKPFVSAPDLNGNSFPFAITWATSDDVGSGVIARAAGLNAEELLPTTGISNTDIYRMLYYTLFGERIPRDRETNTNKGK